LPVFSVNNEKEARKLRLLVCEYDSNNERYVLPQNNPIRTTGFTGEVESLDDVTLYLENIYKMYVENN
jgi:hypothetical protein